MKITYAAAISQDGFIAKEDGDVSWLNELDIAPEDTDVPALFAAVDALVMGRGSYDFVYGYGSWPYEDKPTWVCTSREVEVLDGANLTVVDNIGDVIAGATSRAMEHLWLIGGGLLASGFQDEGLITNVSLSVMPVTLGSGIPLFARHQLDDIPHARKQVTQRQGYRQIEIELQS